MTGIPGSSPFEATSAGGPMVVRRVRPEILWGCLLAGAGTSSTAYAQPSDSVLRAFYATGQTSSGASLPEEAPAGAGIGELRRLSGLTWEQLARLFNVSRRSLHFWASGRVMGPGREEHLQRLLAVVRKIDRGSATANRAALLAVQEDGSLPFDLLARGAYERVLSDLRQLGPQRLSPGRLSGEARAARAPRPPEELVGARHDRIHREKGISRAAKSVRVRSDG